MKFKEDTRKGSVCWVDFSPAKGSEPMGRRPGLVVQNDVLNDSKLNTVIVVAITSTLKFGELPGNVILRKGEANLPKRSVVNMTQIKTVDKVSLKEKGIDQKILIDALEEALETAARRKFGTSVEIEVSYNEELGEIEVFQFKEVVEKVQSEDRY